MEKIQRVSQERMAELQNELEDLKTRGRQEVENEIAEARGHGDLSENSEYDAAKDKQRRIEARIEELEMLLDHIEVIDESAIDTTAVNIGVTVQILNLDSNTEYTFKIVEPVEASLAENKLSNTSPVGAALMGHTSGETLEIMTPGGKVIYKILSITK